MGIKSTIMVVDDEKATVDALQRELRIYGFENIIKCSNSSEALSLINENDVKVLLLDLWMPKISGEKILKEVAQKHPHINTIIITAIDEVNKAVECLNIGAKDYIVKPFEADTVISRINHLLEISSLKEENLLLKKALLNIPVKNTKHFEKIVTINKRMHTIFKYIEAIASSNHPVLITGESGSGKELIADAIHRCSQRKGQFIPVNIAGFDDTLFSDTLFGHTKGAYTGADKARDGLVTRANEGTLFLDEIGELTLNSQIKLLRLLQEKSFFQLGSDVPKKCDTRIVAATNQNLSKLVKEKKFRLDLFFRLQSHHIEIPPLRERKEDIAILANHFLIPEASDTEKRPKIFSQRALKFLQGYSFPGNIRELEGIVIDAIQCTTGDEIDIDVLPKKIRLNNHTKWNENKNINVGFGSQLPTLKKAEELLIEEALKRANQNQTIAAKSLGITRRALYSRISRKNQKKT